MQLTHEDWFEAANPKVEGAINLHKALEKTKLDFFTSFSSISYVVGQIGQANYSAANAFLAAFTQYRHSLGLPATVIDLGVMEDVGFVAATENLLDYFKSQSSTTLTEKDIFDIVRLAITRSSPTLTWKGDGFSDQGQFAPGVRTTLSMYDPNNRVIWKHDRRFAIARTLDVENSSASSTSSNLKAYISGLSSSSDESVEYVAKEIGKTLFGFLMRTVDDMDIEFLEDIDVSDGPNLELVSCRPLPCQPGDDSTIDSAACRRRRPWPGHFRLCDLAWFHSWRPRLHDRPRDPGFSGCCRRGRC